MASDSDTIILRVCNWEEYIDTGDWDEAIELDSGEIKGENSIVKDLKTGIIRFTVKKLWSNIAPSEQMKNYIIC